MAVSNGQLANQTTFNNAFLSKTATTSNTTTGIIGFNNTTDPNSGNAIVNTQRLQNELADATGVTGEGDVTRKNYSSNNVVANGDDRKVAIGKLDAEFDPTTGHNHDGANSRLINAVYSIVGQSGGASTATAVTIEGGNGINTVMSGGDTLTINQENFPFDKAPIVQTLVDNTSTPTVVVGFDDSIYSGAEIKYVIKRGANHQWGVVSIVTDGSAPILLQEFQEIGDAGVTFTTDISGSLTRLLYTTTSTGTDAKLDFTILDLTTPV